MVIDKEVEKFKILNYCSPYIILKWAAVISSNKDID